MCIHEYHLIFIHIPKTGGRSIAAAFGKEFRHQTVHEFSRIAYPEYTTFSIVRNTWDRLVSMYHYIQTDSFHSGHEIQGPCGAQTSFTDWLTLNLRARRADITPGDLGGLKCTEQCLGSPFWFSSQLSWIGSAQRVTVDRLLSYEQLDAQFSDFCRDYGLCVKLPHLNRATGRTDYKHYYTPALRDLVKEHYQDEIQSLGYIFEGERTQ